VKCSRPVDVTEALANSKGERIDESWAWDNPRRMRKRTRTTRM
jgi:hypothetical protein